MSLLKCPQSKRSAIRGTQHRQGVNSAGRGPKKKRIVAAMCKPLHRAVKYSITGLLFKTNIFVQNDEAE